MMENWNTFRPESRVWVYQSSRTLDEQQANWLNAELIRFVDQWAAHGEGLSAYGEVFHQRFIVLMVDEKATSASGCSIDASVHFLKQVEQKLEIDLFDRMQITYREGESIKICQLNEIGDLLKQGIISAETIVFDNLVNTKGAFEKEWEVPLANSWIGKRMALSN